MHQTTREILNRVLGGASAEARNIVQGRNPGSMARGVRRRQLAARWFSMDNPTSLVNIDIAKLRTLQDLTGQELFRQDSGYHNGEIFVGILEFWGFWGFVEIN